jgi:hypothetical protein
VNFSKLKKSVKFTSIKFNQSGVQKIIFQTTINQLYDCVGCVVTDGVSFARVKKSCDSPHKLFYANIEGENIKDREPVVLVADFYENHMGE